MKTSHAGCAEICASSLSLWQAQCWPNTPCPSLGALIVIEHSNADDGSSDNLFGIVASIVTVNNDPVGAFVTYKQNFSELQRDHPEVFAFAVTQITVITVGYGSGAAIAHQLPPHVPHVHALVRLATTEECEQFFSTEQYLQLLFSYHQAGFCVLEDLLLAVIDCRFKHTALSRAQIDAFIQGYAFFTHHDYQRLRGFLARLGERLVL